MSIEIAKSLEDGECNYFYVPALREPSTARAIATAVLWTIVNIAADRVKRGLDVRHAFIAIDECAQLFGSKVMEDVLTLCRKAFCQLYLAHQTSSQLVTRMGDMRAVMTDNTSIRIYSTLPTELDRKEILDHSKTVVKIRKSTTAKGLGASVTMQEMELPGIEGNVCREVAGHFGQAIFVKELGDGHFDPIPIVCVPPVTKEEYIALARRPLPKREAPCIPIPKPPARNAHNAQHAAILQIVEEKRRLLTGWKKKMGGK